ncbi:MAG TPA: FecR domain-containing protein [Thermoanaerobaculia bacterium]
MSSLFKKEEDLLDRAVADVTGEPIDPVMIEQATARVWERLSREAAGGTPVAAAQNESAGVVSATVPAGSLHGCEDFQALIPAYLRGELSPARALLVEDHTRSCVPCRRALRQAREGRSGVAVPAARSTRPARVAWMSLAAMLIVGLGVGLFFLIGEMFDGGDQMARIESIQGALYKIDGSESLPVQTGEILAEGEVVRTAKGSTALVRMTDGSLIEVSERSGFSMEAAFRGNTIHLDRGRVIVQAAKQRQRHLYVGTRDALVSVTGTIFSVNSGTKGSRVSVIEGEVRVKQAKRESVLHPGDQVTTHASVTPVPVRQEIAWSRNAAHYEELLAELTAAGRDIDAQVTRPGLRYSTRLLDLAPAGTRVWVALPNLGQNLEETQRVLDQKIAESPVLRQWWSETIGSSQNDEKFHEMIEKLGALGRHLGGEVSIALAADTGSGAEMHDGQPIVMAEVTDEAAFRAVLEQEIADLNSRHGGEHALQIVTDPASVPAGETEGAWLWIGNGLFVATPSGDALRQVAALAGGAPNPFTGTSFHARIAEEYRDGAGWLLSADLATLVREDREGEADATAERMGVYDLDNFIVNRREVQGGQADTRAALTFDQPRRGVTAWLAAPAPMGSLGFFSPDANLAAAFVVKQPTSLIDDLLAINPEIASELEEVRRELGFDLRNDLAAPLGGEVAMAVDGPLLPEPSWKFVVEVYDPARLQNTLERIVQHLNDEVQSKGRQEVFEIVSEEDGGRTFYTFRGSMTQKQLHYVYEDGYLVATPTRALLERALQQRESGVNLATAPKFRDLLGSDGQVNVSAFFYQNLAPVLDAARGVVPQGAFGGERGADQMANLLLGQGPTLVYAYAQEDRILFASTSESPLGLNLQTLAGFGGILGMMDQAHGQAVEEETR